MNKRRLKEEPILSLTWQKAIDCSQRLRPSARGTLIGLLAKICGVPTEPHAMMNTYGVMNIL